MFYGIQNLNNVTRYWPLVHVRSYSNTNHMIPFYFFTLHLLLYCYPCLSFPPGSHISPYQNFVRFCILLYNSVCVNYYFTPILVSELPYHHLTCVSSLLTALPLHTVVKIKYKIKIRLRLNKINYWKKWHSSDLSLTELELFSLQF